MQLKGGIGEAGDRYERHADTVAEKVVQGESAEALLDAEAGGPTKVSAGPVSGSEPVQMMRLVYVGAGPRSTSHIRAEIDFIAERIKDFESLANAGANYNIRSTVIDQAPRSNFGRGYAWNNRQGVGNVNSGGEASSYEQLAAKYKEVTQNEEGMQRSLYENPVGHSNIELGVRSTAIMADPEHPYMERSVLSRQHQGEQEAQHFDERVEYARKNLSKYYTVRLYRILRPWRPWPGACWRIIRPIAMCWWPSPSDRRCAIPCAFPSIACCWVGNAYLPRPAPCFTTGAGCLSRNHRPYQTCLPILMSCWPSKKKMGRQSESPDLTIIPLCSR